LLASSGKRTLLIDANLRAGKLHTCLGLPSVPGLADALGGIVPAEQVIQRGVRDKLDVITSGTLQSVADHFLQPLNFGSLLDSVSVHYDVVLIVTAPVLTAADALIIGSHAGAVFLVARADQTTQSELSESIKRMNHAGIAPHGIVFNDAPAGSAASTATTAGGGSLIRL
jgi:tyrosine-protein kinase Etk/Wzc